MIKYIKAKRCYICLKLTEVSDGGWLISKKYGVYAGGARKDVFICPECGLHMMNYIRSQRESEESNE